MLTALLVVAYSGLLLLIAAAVLSFLVPAPERTPRALKLVSSRSRPRPARYVTLASPAALHVVAADGGPSQSNFPTKSRVAPFPL